MSVIQTKHIQETSFTVFFPSETGLDVPNARGKSAQLDNIINGLRLLIPFHDVVQDREQRPIKIESYYRNGKISDADPTQWAIIARSSQGHGSSHRRSGGHLEIENNPQLVLLKSSLRSSAFGYFREEDLVTSTYATTSDVEEALNNLGSLYEHSVVLIRHPKIFFTIKDASGVSGTVSYENVVAQTKISNRWDADVLEFRLCGDNVQFLKNGYSAIHRALFQAIEKYGGRILNEKHISEEAYLFLTNLTSPVR